MKTDTLIRCAYCLRPVKLSEVPEPDELVHCTRCDRYFKYRALPFRSVVQKRRNEQEIEEARKAIRQEEQATRRLGSTDCLSSWS